jgi:ribosomal-protein-alanine N-acetyltransferase
MTDFDIGLVQDIERESCNIPWSASTYRRELRNPASRYLVTHASSTPPPPRHHDSPSSRAPLLHSLLASFFPADPGNHNYPLIGYGGVWCVVDEAHITTIAVSPRYRGRGIGELLLNGLIDHAFDAGATMLTLEVRQSNTVAQNLYHKYGFHVAGTRKRYYTDNDEDALIMWTDSMGSVEYQAVLRELRQQLFERLRTQARPPKSQRTDMNQTTYTS